MVMKHYLSLVNVFITLAKHHHHAPGNFGDKTVINPEGLRLTCTMQGL